MGAQDFSQRAKGKTAKEAFKAAREQASWEHGHGAYTGTLAEKTEFVVIPLPEGRAPSEYANGLISSGDPRVDDKWGPAGAIDCGNDTWLFFGWASS